MCSSREKITLLICEKGLVLAKLTFRMRGGIGQVLTRRSCPLKANSVNCKIISRLLLSSVKTTLDKIYLHVFHRHVRHWNCCPALLGDAMPYKPRSLTLLSCTDTLSLPLQAQGPSQGEDETSRGREDTNVSMAKSKPGLWPSLRPSLLAVSKANPGST